MIKYRLIYPINRAIVFLTRKIEIKIEKQIKPTHKTPLGLESTPVGDLFNKVQAQIKVIMEKL